MTTCARLFAVAPAVVVLGLSAPARCETGAWQVEAAPALAPGPLGDWDDFRVSHPCVLRVGSQWRMYYEGARLDENGLTAEIGLATSTDGVHWQKSPQNPLLRPDVSPETDEQSARARSPAVCQLADGSFLMLCLDDNLTSGDAVLRFAHSADGIHWDTSTEREPLLARMDQEMSFSASLFRQSDPPRLQIWYLDAAGDGDRRSLAHAVRMEAGKWSDVVRQPAQDIDADGSIERAQVVPSGDYYLLCYMATKDSGENVVYRFRVSPNARSWLAQGPPDFVPAGAESYGGLAVVYTAEGARLFYYEEREDGSRQIRTAFCPKSAYRATP